MINYSNNQSFASLISVDKNILFFFKRVFYFFFWIEFKQMHGSRIPLSSDFKQRAELNWSWYLERVPSVQKLLEDESCERKTFRMTVHVLEYFVKLKHACSLANSWVTDAVVLPSTLDSFWQELKDFLVEGKATVSVVKSLTKELQISACDSGVAGESIVTRRLNKCFGKRAGVYF